MSVESEARSGRPFTSRNEEVIEKVRQMMEDRRLTLRKIANTPQRFYVDKKYYFEILRRLRDAVRKKRPDMWTGKNWQLHYDNAPAHSAHATSSYSSS